MKRIYYLVLFLCLWGVAAHAAISIDSSKLYSFSSSVFNDNSYLSIGSEHGSSYKLYLATETGSLADDEYWYIAPDGGGYTIQNYSTGQFLSWSNTYSSVEKYLTLVDEVTDNYQRWTFIETNGGVYIQSVGTGYYFNVRTGGTVRLVGTYNGSGANGLFNVCDSNGASIIAEDEPSGSEQVSQIIACNETGVTVTESSSGYSYGWTYSSSDGRLESTNQGVNSSESGIKIMFEVSVPTMLSFDYGVSSETNWDKLYITLDEASLVDQLSGEETGAVSMQMLSPGSHTLILRYEKDGSAASYSDCAFISNLCLNTTEITYITDLTPASSTLSVAEGNQKFIDITITPSDASVQNLLWGSSNTSVATVSNGWVTGVNEGTATITATAQDGSGIQTSVEVTVTSAIVPTTIVDGQFASDTQWYKIIMKGSKIWKGNGVNYYLGTITTSNQSSDELWCLVKNSDNTYSIYNKAAGPTACVCTGTPGNQVYAYIADPTQANPSITSFMIQRDSYGGYNFFASDNSGYALNDYGGNGRPAYWNSTDYGSSHALQMVENPEDYATLVQHVTLYANKYTINVGEQQQLTYQFSPADATVIPGVQWSTSNPDIVQIDDYGVITGAAPGNATIYVTTDDGRNIQASISITVGVEKTVVDPDLIVTDNSAGVSLTANNDRFGFSWVNDGTTIKSDNVGYTGTQAGLDIEIEATQPTAMSFDYSSSSGGSDYMYITFLNTEGITQTLVYSYSSTQGSVGPIYLGAGTNRLSVYYYNSANSASEEDCATVSNLRFTPYVSVTGIALDHAAIKMPPSMDYQLQPVVLPTNATTRGVTWSSSDENIVSVDENGIIHSKQIGTATVTVTTVENNFQDSYQISVYSPSDETIAASDTLFVFQSNGRMTAFPTSLVKSRVNGTDGSLTLTTTNNQVYAFQGYEIDSVTTTFRGTLPEMTSYKFNNKFNDQLLADVVPTPLKRTNASGVEEEYMPHNIDCLIKSAIGKRLTASFKTSTDDAGVYINGVEQQSKVTRNRFEGGTVVYTVAPYYYKVFSSTEVGGIYDVTDPANPVKLSSSTDEFCMMPFGRQYNVNITWATDQAQASADDYGVPVIYINTNDGTDVTSKDYYWDATIRIDGAGVYSDFAQAAVQIKGRGNTSWSKSKKPYRLKFSAKQKLCDMKGGKNWVLLANNQDVRCMTTNPLAMKMADMVESAACNHIVPVELYLNGTYRGQYNLTEKIGFSNNSIDLKDESSAVLLQLDSYYDEAYKFKSNYITIPVNVMEPDLEDEATMDYEATTAKFQAIQDEFNQLTEKLYYNDSSYDEMIDVDAFARAWFVTDLARNCELKHPKSWFVYNENALYEDVDEYGDLIYMPSEDSKYVFGPVWDFDWAFGYDGTGSYFTYSATSDVIGSNGSYSGADFFRALRYNSDKVKKAYYKLWKDFMDRGRLEELLEYAQDYYDFAKRSFQHNGTKWGSVNYETITTLSQEWLRTRANWIYENLDQYDLSDEEVAITIGDVNEDGAITTADVVCVLNYILSLPTESFDFRQADTDGNGLITMKDVSQIVRLVMQANSLGVHRYNLPLAEASLNVTNFNARVGASVEMPLTLDIADGSYSGLQFDIKVPEGCVLEGVSPSDNLRGHTTQMAQVDNRTYRISIYAASSNPIAEGHTQFSITFKANQEVEAKDCLISLTDAMLVSEEAEDHRLSASTVRFYMPSAVTVVNELKTDITSQPVYDLCGRRVLKPMKGGIYLIGGKKMVLK